MWAREPSPYDCFCLCSATVKIIFVLTRDKLMPAVKLLNPLNGICYYHTLDSTNKIRNWTYPCFITLIFVDWASLLISINKRSYRAFENI